ncbi:MAG: hypothetical protein J0L72_08265, partial [Armatimonadetes bacterium]|nr:hypothetical protein [Armatimonadota bacterium]
ESNPELQLQYAMGLVNAIHDKCSKMEEIQNHLESLRNLKGRESNPELQLQFAMGLVNAIHEKRSTMEEIQNHLESLRNLKERESNPELRLEYANGLLNAAIVSKHLRPILVPRVRELLGEDLKPDASEIALLAYLILIAEGDAILKNPALELTKILLEYEQTRMEEQKLFNSLFSNILARYRITSADLR